jgi:hypothetical protein
MKASTILSIASVFAGALAAPAEAAAEDVSIMGGFGASCWDFAMDQTYFYATCSSGGGGSPAYRSAVDLGKSVVGDGVFTANRVAQVLGSRTVMAFSRLTVDEMGRPGSINIEGKSWGSMFSWQDPDEFNFVVSAQQSSN